ncbi:MAG: hypothetical protein ACHREM_13650 [Polyangiales bacterium]
MPTPMESLTDAEIDEAIYFRNDLRTFRHELDVPWVPARVIEQRYQGTQHIAELVRRAADLSLVLIDPSSKEVMPLWWSEGVDMHPRARERERHLRSLQEEQEVETPTRTTAWQRLMSGQDEE